MFPSNYLLFGLLGSGITGVGLMIWWLTNSDKHEISNSAEDEETIKKCGRILRDDWYNNDQYSKTNSKGKNRSDYETCWRDHQNEQALKANASQ